MHILYFRKHMLPRNVTQCVHRVIRLSACPHLPPHSLIVLSKCTLYRTLWTPNNAQNTQSILHTDTVSLKILYWKFLGNTAHWANATIRTTGGEGQVHVIGLPNVGTRPLGQLPNLFPVRRHFADKTFKQGLSKRVVLGQGQPARMLD